MTLKLAGEGPAPAEPKHELPKFRAFMITRAYPANEGKRSLDDEFTATINAFSAVGYVLKSWQFSAREEPGFGACAVMAVFELST